jgi:plastocyanin
VFLGDLVTGAAKVTYTVPALPAGDYTFNCTVHTNMTGTLKVGG